MYKWVDANGQTHYGEKPPASAQSKEIKAKKAVVRADSEQLTRQERLEKQRRLLNAFEEDRNARAADRAEKKELKLAQQQRCKEASGELRDYNRPGTIYYELSDNGDRVFLDAAEIRARIARLENYIKKNCH